jgi:hypothetical protein
MTEKYYFAKIRANMMHFPEVFYQITRGAHSYPYF